MDTNQQPSPAQRRQALARLRTITAGVAVVGIAATAGIGYAAANGYRGTSSAGATTTAGTLGDGGAATDPAATPSSPDQQPGANPLPDGFQAPAPGNGVQPPTRGSRPGHASTGGSG